MRRRRRQIADSLALALAGQVAAGLARNAEPDEAEAQRLAELHGAQAWALELEQVVQRQRAALIAIGLMLGNATTDPHVHQTLDLAGRVTVETRRVR